MKTAYFNRFEVELPADCVADCSQPGPVDENVEYWAGQTPCHISADSIKAELKEYGAWNEDELSDNKANWRRIIWIASCNIKEESD